MLVLDFVFGGGCAFRVSFDVMFGGGFVLSYPIDGSRYVLVSSQGAALTDGWRLGGITLNVYFHIRRTTTFRLRAGRGPL